MSYADRPALPNIAMSGRGSCTPDLSAKAFLAVSDSNDEEGCLETGMASCASARQKTASAFLHTAQYRISACESGCVTRQQCDEEHNAKG